ncbi:HesA/MoeB/ThiF family protein [Phaeobacter sp. NW0010-22]|uniref:HesA/MoeB/ThiF family protein n=1 Tax=Phaeobacter sp. NW0010-22 TaxID=3135907 RepID=UPI00310AA45D
MFLVFFMAAVLWVLGLIMGVSRNARLSTVGTVFGVVLMLQLVLPDGHPLREATGQSPALWLMLAGAFVLALIYGQGLKALRQRANKKEPEMPEKTGTFSETELDRYARHIVLHELGGVGQKRLKQAKVLVIGAGGLGSPALQYLAAAGVGTIGVIDDDEVENANLQRQVIHRDADIGVPKVFSAMQAMEAQNPNVVVHPYHRRLTDEIATDLFADYDLILDGTDNFETRYLVNKTAVETGKPLISGALSQWEGQLSLFEPAKGAPCYQCIFPEAPAAGLAPSCSESGVVGPLPGVVGAMMAVEAVKVITGAGMPLRGEMLIYDALYGESRKITLSKRADCPTCGSIAG